jgi:hypothetical protein
MGKHQILPVNSCNLLEDDLHSKHPAALQNDVKQVQAVVHSNQ